MSQRQLWYVRRGDRVGGPFPSQIVTNNTLLGKFLPSDEVSLDQVEWRPLKTVEALLPPELLAIHKETDPEQRQWLEERLKAARRSEQRNHDGKLDVDPPQDNAVQAGSRRHLGVAVGVVAVLLVALGLVYYQPANPVKVSVVPVLPLCGMAAAPGVNWSGCDKQGVLSRGVDLTRGKLDYANFSHADLSGSRLALASLVGANLHAAKLNHVDLSNADLSNADLSAANLESANLSGAVLDHAIWVDGRVCAAGSLGQCR